MKAAWDSEYCILLIAIVLGLQLTPLIVSRFLDSIVYKFIKLYN